MAASNYVHLEDCTIIRETAMAFMIGYDGGEYWIPKSQIADPDTYDEGDEGVTVSITEFIADKLGIEGD